jgi:hypothetical protein
MGEAVPVEWCTNGDFRVFAMVSPSTCFSRILSRLIPDDPLDKEVVVHGDVSG